jgi:hypothetical protein
MDVAVERSGEPELPANALREVEACIYFGDSGRQGENNVPGRCRPVEGTREPGNPWGVEPASMRYAGLATDATNQHGTPLMAHVQRDRPGEVHPVRLPRPIPESRHTINKPSNGEKKKAGGRPLN